MVSIENFPLKVYITDEAETPCLFGLLRPAVYLTVETPLEGPALRHVLEHERAHRRQGDHILSLIHISVGKPAMLCGEKRLEVHLRCPYRKPTQVDEERILRPAGCLLYTSRCV